LYHLDRYISLKEAALDTEQRDALIEKGWEKRDDNPFSESLSHFETVLAAAQQAWGL